MSDSCFTVFDSDGAAHSLCGFGAEFSANTNIVKDPLSDIDHIWLILCACLVFLMQAGFALLEVGSVGPNISHNILMKNLFDAAMSCLVFYLIGWGIAYGEDSNGFIGTSDFTLVDSESYSLYMFQATFAGAATTIVSGALAGRVKLEAYFIYTLFISAFIYPVVVHWVWGSGGFMNGFEDSKFGIIDFAGSGVVHMVGGFTGLVGTIILGPRLAFTEGTNISHSVTFQVVGTFLLWFGWYGFNCGSTLAAQQGAMDLAALVSMTTTLAASTGCVTATALSYIIYGKVLAPFACNGLLGALVAITANCAVVKGWHAIFIGFIAAFVYAFSSKALKILNIDDPVDASCVHGFCGLWGILATGLFATDQSIANAGYDISLIELSIAERFGRQLLAGVIIIAWSCTSAVIVFMTTDKIIGLRVSEKVERRGIDWVEHGGKALNLSKEPEEILENTSPMLVEEECVDLRDAVFKDRDIQLEEFTP